MAQSQKIKQSLFKRLIAGDLVNYLNYSAGALFVIILLLFAFGERLGFFNAVGLDWVVQTRGIYADCSKAENRHNPYCQPKESRTDREWSDLGKGGGRAMPFTLHGE